MIVYAIITADTTADIIDTIALAINADLIKTISLDKLSLKYGNKLVRLDLDLPEYPQRAETALRNYINARIREADRRRIYRHSDMSVSLAELYFKFWKRDIDEVEKRYKELKEILGD